MFSLVVNLRSGKKKSVLYSEGVDARTKNEIVSAFSLCFYFVLFSFSFSFSFSVVFVFVFIFVFILIGFCYLYQ